MNALDEDFETRLRQRLREAAGDAPTFRGLDAATRRDANATSRPSPPSRRRRWLATAAAVLVLAGAGGTWWATHSGGAPATHQAGEGPGDGDSSSGGCIAALRLDGRTYYGWGDLTRTPRVGEPLGTATVPACGDDTSAMQIRPFALPGVPVDTAVFAEDTVWVNRTLPELRKGLPAALRELTRPVRCHADGTGVMSGTISGINKMPTGQDYAVRPPYTVTFVATRGDSLPLDRYRSVTLRVRITTGTTGADPDLLRAALGHGRSVTASVHCDGRTFVATSLRLTA